MNESTEEYRDPALSRLYHATTEGEPPKALDEIILGQARQACCKPERRRSWWLRLTAPVALAASVVLAVLVSFNVERQPPEFVPPTVPVEQPPALVETRQASPPLPAESPAKGNTDLPAASIKPPVAAQVRQEHTRIQAPSQQKRVPVPFPSAGSAPEVRIPSTASDSLDRGSSSPSVPAPMTAEKTATPPGGDAIRAAKPMAARTMPKGGERVTPDAWIEEIRALRHQGRMTEAERSLAEFRRAYPNYRLPEDLR